MSNGQSLSGVRSRERTMQFSGPYGAMLTVCFGADGIRVESRTSARACSVSDVDIGGRSSYYLSLSRNKRSVALDLGPHLGTWLSSLSLSAVMGALDGIDRVGGDAGRGAGRVRKGREASGCRGAK